MNQTAAMHQCPYCDLKFLYGNEVRDHILKDHPDHENMALTAEIHELPR
jgi:5-methylcytosine-specific restriction endonuclease McrA